MSSPRDTDDSAQAGADSDAAAGTVANASPLPGRRRRLALVMGLLSGLIVLAAVVAPHVLDVALDPARPGGPLAGDWPDLAGPVVDPRHASPQQPRDLPFADLGPQASQPDSPRTAGATDPSPAAEPGVPRPEDAQVWHEIVRDIGGVRETITVWRFDHRSASEAFEHVTGLAHAAGWRATPTGPPAPGFAAQAAFVESTAAGPDNAPQKTLTLAARPDDAARPDAAGARVTLWLRQNVEP